MCDYVLYCILVNGGLVVGQSQLGDIETDPDGRAFCVFVGHMCDDQKNRFQLMNASILATELDEHGWPVTTDSLLKAIRERKATSSCEAIALNNSPPAPCPKARPSSNT